MADFTIKEPVPFIVEGANGDEYELPRLQDLTAEQVGKMASASKSDDLSEKALAVKSFILTLCPDLEKEPLTDMGYMSLFNALGAESDIPMGES